MNQSEQDYTTAIRFFLNACPGPPMLGAALRIVALQDVEGVSGLTSSALVRTGHPGRSSPRYGLPNRNGEYLRSVASTARVLDCRPEYLSETALRHGFSMSVALRWIRFSHGMALRDAGVGVNETAWRLGFNDRAGWHRFTLNLVGKTPAQLPAVPLSFWIREAVRATFLAARGPRGVPAAVGNMRSDNG